ncbi:MAG: LapA family protein [Desulfobacterales bacterium]|nr:LapA family protein [Desulfobacterales bacterium]
MGSYFKLLFKLLLLLIVVVVLVTFGILNREPIKLHYYFQLSSMPIPTYGIVYASIIIGIFIGMLVGISIHFAQRKKFKELQKENRDLKDKVGEPEVEETTEEETAIVEKEAQPDETQEIQDEPEDKEEEKEAGP